LPHGTGRIDAARLQPEQTLTPQQGRNSSFLAPPQTAQGFSMPAPGGRAALAFFSAAESSAKALRIAVASGIATSFLMFVTFNASVLASSSRTCRRSPWRPTTVPHLPLCSAAPLSECSSTRSPFR
jgi:hypothetical protein